ncbi:MAG: TIGR03088 family PEP-CTERM/XrtA system glycosyltransferase [Neptunomonas phycophila]|uniref:TIGR03088 family PEP-CTERM/XrtA system glycosyltransferase n=1 Tax=Neptunomonas phycophila TaxID=1572645 RepID=UPI003B8E0D39
MKTSKYIDKPLVMHVLHTLGTGGMENGLVNILNRMPSDRYRHMIVCLSHATDFSQRIESDDIAIVELHKKEGNDLSIYWKLLRLFWAYRPAIVHSRNLAALDIHVLKVLAPSFRSVHGEHGRDIYDLEGKNKKYNALRSVMKHFISQYIAVSKDLEQWLVSTINVPPRKVYQIYNGVNHQQFIPLTAHEKQLALSSFFSDDEAKQPVPPRFIIGTVGRLAAVKDQKTLIKSFGLFLKALPQEQQAKTNLLMVGDGPLYQELNDEITRLGLSEHVLMLGDRSDVARLLPLMDVFVLSSLAEGISNTVLEAMASQLPIVATETGGNPELVSDQENGFLFRVGDHQQLADILMELWRDPDKRHNMAEASLNKVRHEFDWYKTVANYVAVYDSLVATKTENAVKGS